MKPVALVSGGMPVEGSAAPRQRQELRRAAEAFEALLVQQLVKQIRQSQLERGMFGNGPGASVYDAMFDQYLGERLARDSPFGIAELLEARWAENLDRPDNTDRAARETRTNLRDVGVGAQVSRLGADD